eukprot:jgi/Hompol1/3841/HPOL_006776-RA
MLSFNIEHGFLEGILRGYKAGVLSSSTYMNLTQCETLEGKRLRLRLHLKLQLAATDYGNFLQNEPSPLSTATIAEKARDKLVAEFEYLRANANKPLSTFLDYLT